MLAKGVVRNFRRSRKRVAWKRALDSIVIGPDHLAPSMPPLTAQRSSTGLAGGKDSPALLISNISTGRAGKRLSSLE